MAIEQYLDQDGSLVDDDEFSNDWDDDPWGDRGYMEDPIAFASPEEPPAGPAPTPGPVGPVVGPEPVSGGGGGSYSGGGDSGGGSLLNPYSRTFQSPDPYAAAQGAIGLLPKVPQFNAPAIPDIDPFSYDPFAATTGEHVFSDPSFGFRKDIGEKALTNSRAAQGLARTGGTLKDLLAYNQNFASQEFGNVDARRRTDYGVNRGNALENWRSNADTTLRRAGLDQERARSMYEPQFAEYQNQVSAATRAPQQARDNAFQEFLADFDIWRDNRDSIFDKLKWTSEFGLDASQ